MFAELEQFIMVHRTCGSLTSDVGEMTESGYSIRLACSCGAAFERWVTPDMDDHDVLRSRLLAFPN